MLCTGSRKARSDERWRSNDSRVLNRDELHEAIEAVLIEETSQIWIERMRAAGIFCGPINDIEEAFRLARDLELDPVAVLRRDNGSQVPTVANPIRFSRTPVNHRQAPPRLGESEELPK